MEELLEVKEIMRSLYHVPLCPFCRKIRLVLAEKKLDHALIYEPVWKKNEDFLEMNPAGTVPLLIDLNKKIVIDSYAIAEYLEEAYGGDTLIGMDPFSRAETRRLVAWFDDKFNREVTKPVVYEKALKRLFGEGGPDSTALRAGKAALDEHMDYLAWLVERRNWLAGDALTLADLAGAAHLSVLDYIGHIAWDNYPEVKFWYARLKSRPGFRPLLQDRMPGINMASHYPDLDF